MSTAPTGPGRKPESAPANAPREAALREILGVIRRSRHNEAPVFEVILENASRLCNAPLAALSLINEQRTHYEFVALRGARPEMEEYIRANPPELDPARYVAARAMVEMRTVHVDDLGDPRLYCASDRVRRQSDALEGIRVPVEVHVVIGAREG